MQLDTKDQDRLTHGCVRSAMVMIAWELDQLMATPELRRWCSTATIELLQKTMEQHRALKITRRVVMYARLVAQQGAAMTWLKTEEVSA